MKTIYSKIVVLLLSQAFASISFAQAPDVYQIEAKKLLERISSVKVPVDHPLIAPMAAKIRSGDRLGAAEIATTHPEFLNTTVKQMALKLSTREETLRLSLNDFAANFIGVTRDGLDARELLMGNFYYSGDMTKIPATANVRFDLSADILKNNNHFEDLSDSKKGIDVGAVLKRTNGQKLLDAIEVVVDNPEPAGVITSRTFITAHAIAGTNRRPVEFTFREFMCVPMSEMADTGVSDERVARDISRFPGGDHLKYQTTCKGCHTQMDSFRGAFAFWDVQRNRPINSMAGDKGGGFDGNNVSNKLNVNGNVFSGGYQYKDNSFFNNSRGPANANLFGWRGAVGAGRGTTAFASQIANSSRFSQCMVKRIYDSVCRANINPKTEIEFLRNQAVAFEQMGYNIKKMYQSLAILSNCQAQ